VRQAWFSSGVATGDGMIGEAEFGKAAFVLMVSYERPSKGVYRIKARIRPRDAEIAARIKRHRLREVKVYTDNAAEEADERKAALDKEMKAKLDEQGPGYFWSCEVCWDAMRQAVGWAKQVGTVRITLGSLLDGQEFSGSFEEMSRLAKTLTSAVDLLSAKIDGGAAFDSGGTRIYAPGARTKTPKTKPETPPSEWGS
jgi:hypothetical protein